MTNTDLISNPMHALLHNARTVVDQVANKPSTSTYLQECSGILIMSSTEYSLVLSGQHGAGVMLKHFKDTHEWSNPSATRIRGVGAGFQMGKSNKNIIMFLSEHELRTLTDTAILQFGIQGSFDIFHKEADTYLMVSDILRVNGKSRDANTVKGSKVGISLQGAAISPLWNVNRDFYGDLWYPNVVKAVPKKIMEGKTKKELSSRDKKYVGALQVSLKRATWPDMEVNLSESSDFGVDPRMSTTPPHASSPAVVA